MAQKEIKKPICDSAIHVLRLLDCEGFSDEAFATIKRYWQRNVANPRRMERVGRNKKAFSDMVKEKLDEGDRIVLGRMMSLYARQAFDTGLRIGLGIKSIEEFRPITEEEMEA